MADDHSPVTPVVPDGAHLTVAPQNTGNSLWGWNQLIDAATGDYLFLLSGDDELLPTSIEDCVQCVEKRGGDWIYGGLEVIDKDSKTIEMWDYAGAPTEPVRALATLLMRKQLPIPFVGMWRVEWLRSNGLHAVPFPDMTETVDTSTSIHWLRCWPRIRRVPVPIARYRRYGGQETERIDRDKLAQQIDKVYHELFDDETLRLFSTAVRG